MTTLVASVLDKFENIGDPRVNRWLFIGNPIPLVIYILAYLYFVLVAGPKHMQNRKPYNLKNIIRAYNVFQIGSCIYLFYAILTCGWTERKFTLGCQPVEVSYEPQSMKLAGLMWWTMVLKMVEFLETVFFVLRKKDNQVSFLHLYHHVSTLAFCWLGATFVPGGMASFPVMLNCLVHVLMYFYYLLATMGPKVQKQISKFKPYITIIQMVQFTILMCHGIPALSPSCTVPKIFPYFYILNVALVYYLFYDFYKKSYKQKSHSK